MQPADPTRSLSKHLSISPKFSPVLLLVLAPFVLLAPAWLTGQALFWGIPVLQFVPWWAATMDALRQGAMPLWNPLVGMGAPLAANYQSALFYPPTWGMLALAAVGGTPLMAWGQALWVAGHLALAGVGMYRLARRIGILPFGALVSGLAFGLSAFLVTRAWFLSESAALGWLPWVLLYVTPVRFDGLAERQRGDNWRLALVGGLQLLAGHAQFTWYTWLLAGMWVVYWSWTQSQTEAAAGSLRHRLVQSVSGTLRRVVRLALHLAPAVALAVGLAAVQLGLTAEYLMQSQRSEAVDYLVGLDYSFSPFRLIGLAAPDMLGSPVQGNFQGYGNYWEDAIYIGLLPFLLALGTAVKALLGRRAKTQPGAEAAEQPDFIQFGRFLLAVFLLALVLALGRNTPIFPWLYFHVPTFDMFNGPTRYMIWGVFSLALLAGLGAQGWNRPEGRALYWTRLGTMGAAAVSLGAGLGVVLFSDISPIFLRPTAMAGLWGVGAGLLSLVAPLGRSRENIASEMEHKLAEVRASAPPPGASLLRRLNKKSAPPNPLVLPVLPTATWQALIVAFITLDLLIANWGFNPSAGRDLYAGAAPGVDTVRELLDGGRLYLPPKEEQVIKFRRFWRFESFKIHEDWRGVRAALLPNANIFDSVASANNFDPLVPGRYSRWMKTLPALEPEAQERLLRLMDVRLVERVGWAQPHGVRWKPVREASRLRWVGCAAVVQSAEEAWQWVFDPANDLETQVALEGAPGVAACDPQTTAKSQVELLGETPNRLEIRVSSDTAGWVVLSDVWYPGWTARVDGAGQPVLRANYLFRAVPVPAGQHMLVFEYRPPVFSIGLVISLLSLVGTLGMAWLTGSRAAKDA